MLAAIGAARSTTLFADVPEGVRLGRAARPAAGQARAGGLRATCASSRPATSPPRTRSPSSARACTTTTCRRSWTRSSPRSEFLTPYTPYQPEVSQGGLQVMFEYQTAISELTGLPVSNASVYEGPSARRRRRLPGQAAPAAAHALPRLARRAPARARDARAPRASAGARRSRSCRCADGVTDADALARRAGRRRLARCSSQQPNFLGAVEDLEALVPAAKAAGALVVVQCDPIPLGILRPPGEFGVDIAVGRGPDARQPARLRRPELRLLRRPGGATCAACRAGSPARRPTSTAAAASCSRCRRASSTSAARRPRTTSAPRRR